MKKPERHIWLMNHFHHQAELSGYLENWDVLNAYFVVDYIEATDAKFDPMPYGAAKCAMLGRDLSELAARGMLQRYRTGIEGMAGMGFPKWVWSYKLKEPYGSKQANVITGHPERTSQTGG